MMKRQRNRAALLAVCAGLLLASGVRANVTYDLDCSGDVLNCIGGTYNLGPTTVTGADSTAVVDSSTNYLTADGTFSSSSGWTINGSNWTITGGVAVHTAPDLPASTLAGTTSATTSTGMVEIVATISGRTAGYVRVFYSGRDLGAITTPGSLLSTVGWSTNGVNTVYGWTWSANPTLQFVPSLDFDGSLDNVAIYAVDPSTPDFSVLSNAPPITGQPTAPMEFSVGANMERSLCIGTGSCRYAMPNNTLGGGTAATSHNACIGYAACQFLTDGFQNTALGYWALNAVTSGHGNTGVGNGAGDAITGGWENSFYGHHAAVKTTIGYQNAGYGAYSLVSNTTGHGNVAVGANASTLNGTGNELVAIGANAGYSSLYVNGQVAIGAYALNDNLGGDGNTAIGYHSLGLDTGSRNTALGWYTGYWLGSGHDNTYVGYNAGVGTDPTQAAAWDSYGILIGDNAGRGVPQNTALNNYIGIGHEVVVDASNQVVIGNNSITQTNLYGHVRLSGTAPTLSSCGTSPSSVSGSDSAGTFTMGTGSPSSCAVTFATAWEHPPSCIVNNQSTSTAVHAASITTTGMVVTLASGQSSDIINYICMGWKQ